jgi:prolyl oligopeptidase PreP (S9A serine peptidase family)
MKFLRTYESQRVMGFKLSNQQMTRCIINIETDGDENIKFKIMDILDKIDVDCNSVAGSKSSYSADVNVYDEKECQAIINDLHIKLMLDGTKVSYSNYNIKS